MVYFWPFAPVWPSRMSPMLSDSVGSPFWLRDLRMWRRMMALELAASEIDSPGNISLVK